MTDLLLRPDGLRRGPRAAAVRDPWVFIWDDRVCHCGIECPGELPEGTPVLTGGWLVEPLADAHVHLFLTGSFDAGVRKTAVHLSHQAALQRALGLLEQYRRQGIAAVRDGGDPRGLALDAAKIANPHPARYAAVLPSGGPVFRRGRYGGFLGRGVDTLAEALRLLEANRRGGATQTKILATGINSLQSAGRIDGPQFTATELGQIVEASRALGLPVMVHGNGSLGDLLSEAPPFLTLEHGFGIDDRTLARLAEQRVAWTPTLGAWAEMARTPGLGKAERGVIAATDALHRREVARGRALGVTILAGSDAGTPGVAHGTGLVGEIRRLAGAGLGSAEALGAASYASRGLCEQALGRSLGGLEEGSVAGFLWIREDPAANPDSLLEPLGVWLGGAWTDLRVTSYHA